MSICLHASQDMWNNSDKGLMQDMTKVLLLRNSSAAYTTLKVTSLSYTCKKLSHPHDEAMQAECKLQKAKTVLENWGHYQKTVNLEAEMWKQACADRRMLADARILHDLAEASRIAGDGAAAAESHCKTHAFMPAIGSTTLEQAACTFSKFLDDIALLENHVGKMIPSLIVWDLNGIPANLLTGGEEPLQTRLCQQLHLMKDLLAARPQYTMGIIIERRSNPPGRMTRRAFHAAIYSNLEAKGIDCDTDLALNFKEISRPMSSTFALPLPSPHQHSHKASNWCIRQPLAAS